MKAIILHEPGRFEYITKEKPSDLKPDDVLLKIKKVSICGTDLHAYKGKQPFFTYPRILGHEVSAEIIALGSEVKGLKVGDKCTVEPYRNLVEDQAVRKGKTNCGSTLTVLGVHEDGAMQEYITYKAANVHLTEGLDDDQVSLVEPLAIGAHAVDRAQILHDDTVLVIGAGPIGLGVAAIARLSGVKVAVVDLLQGRLDFIKHKFPEVETILLSDHTEDAIKNAFQGELPTMLFDATGSKVSMENSFNLIAQGGTIVFVGLFVGTVTFDDPNFHRKEITLKASRSARAQDFKKVIQLLQAGLIDTEGYITHRIPFDHLIDDFETLYQPDQNLIKAVIDF
ncbi:zinc-binding alcohol dehydrogenase family protein [Sphingobacterium sp. JUb56]|uniref:zinc-binding alcohol dehydrogenase family protein n=1 Tax=Sphingobacterium sp. JUb56 TaxID=2587145 RepID=UPI00160F125C|nr:zinc-binding alcohol dehydrogenase family protein [Sphingobacterium sp. JUb56]MBB2949517.1 2-desacetyl-2-hydroxyethyl bacteriochlorophyllide A dehydrogenase [Sphingobacterium sp. JUb56]